jgi:hypothetical protein
MVAETMQALFTSSRVGIVGLLSAFRSGVGPGGCRGRGRVPGQAQTVRVA